MRLVRTCWRYAQAILGIVFRHPVTGVAIIPILPDGRIVLARHQGTDEWAIPGGFVDWGEEVLATARRELLEETGLTLVRVRRLVGVYSAPDRDPRLHAISIVLAADAEGEPGAHDTAEIGEVRAFGQDELPFGRLRHDHDRKLADYLADRTAVA